MKTFKTVLYTLIIYCVLPIVSYSQVDNVQLYTFAHSLIDHRPPAIATPDDETTILFWMADIAEHANQTFASTGQFGQLNNHVDNLPPNSNLGYASVANSWDETSSSFANSNLNTVMLTVANFIQYEPPTNPSPSDPSQRSIVNMTNTLFNWTNGEKPGMKYYIYANWPEMDLASAFPPTPPLQSEIDFFHNTTKGSIGSFASWWTTYQDELMTTIPDLDVRLIPVGPIISKILTEVLPTPIPFEQLYEDSAPHGRANIYFLAGMISYMAIYETEIPDTYLPSDIISNEIRTNLEAINNRIWTELNAFNFENGDSRVFSSNLTSSNRKASVEQVSIGPNPVSDLLHIRTQLDKPFTLDIIGMDGRIYQSAAPQNSTEAVDVGQLPSGSYILRLKTVADQSVLQTTFVKQ